MSVYCHFKVHSHEAKPKAISTSLQKNITVLLIRKNLYFVKDLWLSAHNPEVSPCAYQTHLSVTPPSSLHFFTSTDVTWQTKTEGIFACKLVRKLLLSFSGSGVQVVTRSRSLRLSRVVITTGKPIISWRNLTIMISFVFLHPENIRSVNHCLICNF